ncbi:putative cytochrome P450 pisatin demethylase [Ilyonectria destructans]|nr:putative cytochrome P450 pisatin demethylase [Ilyonectria destructans]
MSSLTGIFDIPGPFPASFSSIWKTWDTYEGCSQYTGEEDYLASPFPRRLSQWGFTKTAFYPIQAARYEKKSLLSLFAARDEAYRSRIKRPIAHSYSMAALTDLEPKIDHVSKLLMHKLQSFEAKNEAFDLGEWLQWHAFDVIGNLTFSRTLGFIEESRDIDNIIASIGAFFIYAAVTFNPAVNFAIKCIDEMGEKDNGVRSGLDGAAFRSANIVNHTSTNVLAGSDTTAIALRSIIHNLITSPICYSTLQREIDSWDKAGKLSDPAKESEAKQRPYLQAIIKEGMRFRPSGRATICGKFFPEGYVVGMNPWVAARDKRVYGEDADEFRPERWPEADMEQLKEMERSSLAFGAGSRVCIGKNISLM